MKIDATMKLPPVRTYLRSKFDRSIYFVRRHSSNSIVGNKEIGKPSKPSLPKGYDVTIIESQWYQWWKKNEFFNRNSKETFDSGAEFVMCIPPPNVTGNLHIGHALTVAVEDTYLRWRRMMGDRCVWIPGFDHAGIATQLMVEKWLLREKGMKKRDITREQFVEQCLIWKEQRVNDISRQLSRLGASLDWNRCFYTMDDKFSNAVYHAFQSLHADGLIFRDRRLVNWSPYLQSTLSDIEIDMKTIDQPIKYQLPCSTDQSKSADVGWMYYVRYKFFSTIDNDEIIIATTRPETIPADVALAVHPADERARKYVGRYVLNPLVDGHVIPIVADEQVDPSLGTGVLKVTPGHDRVDFEIGKRHSLPMDLNIFNDDGTVSSTACLCSDLCGLDRFRARQIAVDLLKSKGCLADKRPHQTVLSVCGKTGDIVEQMPKYQWFLDCRRMADKTLRMLERNELKVYPDFFGKQMKHWLERSNDWCLSRQLYWGHRLPVYRVNFTGSRDQEFIVSDDRASAYTSAVQKFGRNVTNVEQETDVLDTWFSSALTPLVVNGWPWNYETSNHGPPLNLMETGHDILGFWVVRMAILGLHFTDQLPFEDVLLHGIVRDAHGRKMSKSLGNVVDPVDIIEGKSLQNLLESVDHSNFSTEEKIKAKNALSTNFPKGIPECGADALRFSLLFEDVKVYTMNIDIANIENKRRFCNKIWQSFNYMKKAWRIDTVEAIAGSEDEYFAVLSYEDKWILSRLSHVVDNVNCSFRTYDFHQATNNLYNFWWHDLCDIYLEYTKPFVWKMHEKDEDLVRIGRVFLTVADIFCRLLAPFMPFLTEEVHNLLPIDEYKDISIHQRRFPLIKQCDFRDLKLETDMESVRLIINGVRSLKKEFGLSLNSNVEGIIVANQDVLDAVRKFGSVIASLAKLSPDVKLISNSALSKNNHDFSLRDYVYFMVTQSCHLYIKMQDADRHHVLKAVEKQIAKRRKDVEYLQRKTARLDRLTKLTGKLHEAANVSDDLEKLNGEIERLSKTLAQISS